MSARTTASLCLLPLAAAASAPAGAQQVLFTEFFEEVFSLDIETGALVDLVDTPIAEPSPFGQHLAVAGDGAVYVSDFGRLFRFDPGAAEPYTQVADLGPARSLGEVTRGASPSGLVGIDGGAIVSIDPLSGSVQTLFDDAFFSASDVVVDAGGRVFATEFFGGLGFLDPGAAGFVEIGGFGSLDLDHLDIGPDGLIYASTGFDNGFLSVDPATGAVVDLGVQVYDAIDDLRVSDDNTLLFAGRVAGEDGVFRLGEGGSVVALTTGGGEAFFNPQDLDLGSATLRTTMVPEPGAALALAAAAGLASLRRRPRVG